MILLPISSWSEFLLLAANKQLGLHYSEFTDRYEVYINEGVLVWNICLLKDGSPSVLNFEQNYKSVSNRPSFFLGQFRNKYANITGNSSSTIKSGSGVIRGISINNNNTGGTVIVYDNTSASGTKIGSFLIGTPSGGILSTTGLNSPNYITLTAEFNTGLTVVTAGSNNNDITIYYT